MLGECELRDCLRLKHFIPSCSILPPGSQHSHHLTGRLYMVIVASPIQYCETLLDTLYGGSLQSSKICKAIRKPRFREVKGHIGVSSEAKTQTQVCLAAKAPEAVNSNRNKLRVEEQTCRAVQHKQRERAWLQSKPSHPIFGLSQACPP